METSHAIDTNSDINQHFARSGHTGGKNTTPEWTDQATRDPARPKYETVDTEGRPATCLVWF